MVQSMSEKSAINLTERKSLDEGIYARNYFKEDPNGLKMVDYIAKQLGREVRSVYLLSYNRSQATAFVRFLINAEIVVHFEYVPAEISEHIKAMIKQEDLEPFEQISLKEYKKGLKRQDQVKLNTFLQLAHRDMVEDGT